MWGSTMVLLMQLVMMFCLSLNWSNVLVQPLNFMNESSPRSFQRKAVPRVFQVPRWTTTDLLKSLLLLPQSVVFSSELLNVQGGQSGSILKALLYPLLHADEDTNKTEHTLCRVATVWIDMAHWEDGALLSDCVCAYSVMVVSRSLSLRFCSSRCVSFSRSCERVVSRQTSNSRTFSWSWATCCSASRSWCKTWHVSRFKHLQP